MRQLTVELNDDEMSQLEAAARAQNLTPSDMIKAEVLKALTPVGTIGPSDGAAVTIVKTPSTDDLAREDRRQARLAILMRSNGIWAGEPNKPKDGLVYQKELRAEWQ